MMQFNLMQSRVSIQLGNKLGEGGEGAIYEIPSKPDCVAKVYLKQPDSQKIQKLLAMPALLSEPIKKIAAWPLDLLLDQQNIVRGFVMPKIAARKDIHELYSPKSRSIAFPEADFRFLVHVCGNIARAFQIIHQQGHVIGDINHGSVLLGPDGTVAIIDCDSFQVMTASKQVFTCDVGMPLFTAPEIQGQSLRGFHRTQNHDHFGLAVLMFHLLCMGRHPFAGRFSGTGDMPIERAIAESRFAYGANRRTLEMDRPPGTLPLEALGTAVGGLFENAFAKAAITGGRPDAHSWVKALDDLKSKLRVCPNAAWHYYANENQACPWCDVESKTGVRLFGQRITPTSPTGVIDVEALWRAIASVNLPSEAPSLPSDKTWSPPQGVVLPNAALTIARKVIGVLLIAIGVFGCVSGTRFSLLLAVVGAAIFPWVRAGSRASALRAVERAEDAYEDARTRWEREASNERIKAKRRELEKAKRDLIDMPNERQRLLTKMDSEREYQQRQRHLDRYKIENADIHRIGPGRTAMLASFGIETAADVNTKAILKISGFGPAMAASLVAWREQIERAFRFNPKEPVDAQEIAAMDQRLNQDRQKALTLEILASRQRLMPFLQRLWDEVMIARARKSAI
jgi:DNA-binding helix-hairpin-helix protein with protein kinase domain